MNALLSRSTHALAAGALSVALLSAGSAGAFAASSPKPHPSHSSSMSPMTMGSITVKADKTTVKSGDEVTFTGRVKGLKTGTKLTLQHQKGNKWTTLKGSTTVNKGYAYTLKHKFTNKGTEHLRIAAGKVYSSEVTLKVN